MNIDMVNLNMRVPAAVHPPEIEGRARDQVKLLTIDRQTETIRHGSLPDLAQQLRPGDLIVVNNSMTIGASLPASINGIPHRVHLAARLSAHRIIAELRTEDGLPDATSLPVGTIVTLTLPSRTDPSHVGMITSHFHPHSRLWTLDTSTDWYEVAATIGQPIHYHYLDAPYPIEYYSTVFGRVPGSAEMASASRPFTPELVHRLVDRQIQFATLTLHTTVSSHEIDATTGDFPLVPEWYYIPALTRSQVQTAHASHRRVIALGTTVARALESWESGIGHTGWTQHLITPHHPPRITSGLITGLHDSFTSHLFLLYAYAGELSIRKAYAEAARQGYRWHEFGDLSLIL